jgi:ABC-type uncharacterized transport system substrate-binding protein
MPEYPAMSLGMLGLVAVFIVSGLATPVGVEAQAGKVYRVGILSTGNARPAAIFQAFEQRLRELGYVDGQNLAIEFRNAEGKTDRLPGLAAELVRLNVDVVVVATDPATRAVKEASAKIPIVMVSVNYDPVELGYIASLTKLKAVHASLESHIREEEQDIFPRISKVWDENKLKQAGTEMKEMKAKKLKRTTVR